MEARTVAELIDALVQQADDLGVDPSELELNCVAHVSYDSNYPGTVEVEVQ